MSQRVVVLTDEDRAKAFLTFWEKLCREGDPELIVNKFAVAFRAGFDAALEHPEGITDDLRSAIAALKDGGSYHVAAHLEAALFPGDGEQ